jgi:hypothetical protein
MGVVYRQILISSLSDNEGGKRYHFAKKNKFTTGGGGYGYATPRGSNVQPKAVETGTTAKGNVKGSGVVRGTSKTGKPFLRRIKTGASRRLGPKGRKAVKSVGAQPGRVGGYVGTKAGQATGYAVTRVGQAGEYAVNAAKAHPRRTKGAALVGAGLAATGGGLVAYKKSRKKKRRRRAAA